MTLAGLLGLAAPSPAIASDAPPSWTVVGARVPTQAVYTVEWTLGVRAVPLTLPRGTAGMVVARSIVEDDTSRTGTDALFTGGMRVVGGVGRHLYLGGEYEMGYAGSHTPITVDHPDTPRGMSSLQVVAIAGLRAHVRPLTVGAELATGGRLLSRDYEGDRDLDGFESLMERGAVLEARVRAGIWTSPYWQVGAVYGKSLLDDAWTIGLYFGPTSRPFGR